MTNTLITKSNTVQQEIFKEIEKSLSPYLKEIIDLQNWSSIIYSLNTVFQDFILEEKILRIKEICNIFCSDYILEYDINFSEGWFLYCHLRKGHLMLKFVPKEF